MVVFETFKNHVKSPKTRATIICNADEKAAKEIAVNIAKEQAANFRHSPINLIRGGNVLFGRVKQPVRDYEGMRTKQKLSVGVPGTPLPPYKVKQTTIFSLF